MDTHIYLAVERLEALLLSLREQVAELREQMEANEKHRRSTELGARLFEQSEYWLDGDGRRLGP